MLYRLLFGEGLLIVEASPNGLRLLDVRLPSQDFFLLAPLRSCPLTRNLRQLFMNDLHRSISDFKVLIDLLLEYYGLCVLDL